jgi:hypothetical protein
MSLISEQAPPRSANHDGRHTGRGWSPGGPHVNIRAVLSLSVGGLILGLLGGLAIGGGGDEALKVTGPGPTKTVAGVPVGYQRTKGGAVAAAAAYTRVLAQSLGKGSSQRDAVLSAASLAERKAELSGDGTAGLSEVEKALEASHGFVRLGILGQRVSAFTPDIAKISLWTVSVVTQPGSPGQASWGAGEVELHWLDNDWKLWSTTVDDAAPLVPSLVGSPSPGDQFEKSASGYSEIDDVGQ